MNEEQLTDLSFGDNSQDLFSNIIDLIEKGDIFYHEGISGVDLVLFDYFLCVDVLNEPFHAHCS